MKLLLLLTLVLTSCTQKNMGFIKDNCNIKKLTYSENDFNIKLSMYARTDRSDTKAILILPPTGGKNYIDKKYAEYFCKNGYTSFILENWTDDDEYSIDLDIHNRYMRRAQKALFLTLDKLQNYNIGIFATSAGGFIANVAMGNPELGKNIKAYYSVVSGTPLCSSIASANERLLKRVRKIRMKRFDFKTHQQYETALCEAIVWKIPKEKPSHIHFAAVMSTEDTTVPGDFQKNLITHWSAEPEFSIKHHSSHANSIIRTYYFHREQILRFFDESVN